MTFKTLYLNKEYIFEITPLISRGNKQVVLQYLGEIKDGKIQKLSFSQDIDLSKSDNLYDFLSSLK